MSKFELTGLQERIEMYKTEDLPSKYKGFYENTCDYNKNFHIFMGLFKMNTADINEVSHQYFFS